MSYFSLLCPVAYSESDSLPYLLHKPLLERLASPNYSDLIVSITANVITINVTITITAVIPFTPQIRLAGLYQ